MEQGIRLTIRYGMCELEDQGGCRKAARFGVEPELVRLLIKIVDERLAAPKQTAAEPEPEEIETQDQPEQEQPEELCIDKQTQERLKSLYKNIEELTKKIAKELLIAREILWTQSRYCGKRNRTR